MLPNMECLRQKLKWLDVQLKWKHGAVETLAHETLDVMQNSVFFLDFFRWSISCL
jgi:hypothetical protein